jgi:hypothetical protein
MTALTTPANNAAEEVAAVAAPESSEEAPQAFITQPHLAKQDASTVDASKLTALTPEVVRAFDFI